MPNKEQLRGEFYKYAQKDEIDDLSFHELLEETADWWLSKFDSLLEAHNREIAEKVERMWTFRAEGKNAIFTPNGLVDKGHVLSLLQANKEDK